jgi:hypothetical protein
MAQRGVPPGWDSSADRPSILAITVESTSRRPAGPDPTGVRPAHVLIAIAVLGAIAAAIVIAVLPGGGPGSTPARPTPTAPQPTVLVNSGPPAGAVTGPYLFPVGCQGSPVIGTQRGATAPCWRHHPSVTVVLRRVGNHWRGTLTPRSTPCSRMPLPPVERRKLKACRR